MQFNYRAAARFRARQFVRLAWTTTQQWRATSFLDTRLTLLTLVVSGFSIAVFGTVFAGWWSATFIITVFFGLVGNRVSAGRENATLLRRAHSGARKKLCP